MKLPISIFANASGGIAETSTDKPPIARTPRLDAIFSTWPATKTGVAPDTYGEPETVIKAAFLGEETVRDSIATKPPATSALVPAFLVNFLPFEAKTVCASIRYVWPRTVTSTESGDTFSTGPATNAVCADAAAAKAQPSNARGYLFAFFHVRCFVPPHHSLGWSTLDKIPTKLRPASQD